MTEEERVEKFEHELLPKVKDAFVEVMNYIEEKKLPSAYVACLSSYIENFVIGKAIKWKEHCEEYGVRMDFSELTEALEKIESLDKYVKEFK